MAPFKYGMIVDGENYCPRAELARQFSKLQASTVSVPALVQTAPPLEFWVLPVVSQPMNALLRSVVSAAVFSLLWYRAPPSLLQLQPENDTPFSSASVPLR